MTASNATILAWELQALLLKQQSPIGRKRREEPRSPVRAGARSGAREAMTVGCIVSLLSILLSLHNHVARA